MNAQQLKNSILQLAVQGKLVPQDPNDEPASALIERIRAEKERLIKEKKIKPDKNPSYIFRGSDNLPYEKVGKNEPVCIADEVPFDIPDSWEWVRLGNIGDWGSGATPSRTNSAYYNGDIPWLKTGDLTDGYIYEIPECITRLALKETSVRLNPAKSVLIAMYGATIGKLGILTFPATTNQACCACLPYNGIYNEFLFYFLMAQKKAFIKQGEGGAQPNISKEKIVATLMPVPPLPEQQRIVDKLKELEPYINDYDKAYEKIEKLNTDFPDLLKKSILQEAVQGKLVPQDPTDEPASVLIEQIRQEKEQLIKDKKIKKDKNESFIFRRDNSHYEKIGKEERCIDDEIPFDIPDSWEWCTLASVTEQIHYGYTASAAPVGDAKLARITDIQDNKIMWETVPYCSISKENLPKYKLKNRDILIARTGGTIGKTYIVRNLNENAVFASYLIRAIPLQLVNEEYLKLFMESPLYWEQLKAYSMGTGQPNVNGQSLSKLRLPLPPLNEQQRIVEYYKNILPKIKALK